jgi:hypothetical protein
MKKIMAAIILALMLILPGSLFAAGSCTQSLIVNTGSIALIRFICTGDSGNGSIPNTDVSASNMAIIQNTHFLFTVTAYPTSGGTAPDAADVQILQNGMDLLGTKGVNLIHATATQDTFPYSSFMGSYRYPAIVSTNTLAVANQATVSANYTIDLLYSR